MDSKEKTFEYIKDLTLILKSMDKNNEKFILFIKCMKEGKFGFMSMNNLDYVSLLNAFNVFIETIETELKNNSEHCDCNACNKAVPMLGKIVKTYEEELKEEIKE